MDLLGHQWLHGLGKNEVERPLAPLEVGDSRWRDLATPRPDFQSAAYQFLVGLLQTGFAPADRDEWRDRLANPPSPDELERAFTPFRHAFLLENPGGPAFLQDLAPGDFREAEARDLLFEQGSESGQFFSKPQPDFGLCDACAALALITLQFNAPSGGRGTRTSLRGGGPVTTLLVPPQDEATLWGWLWINVIPLDELSYALVKEVGEVFPWLVPTRRSDRQADPVTTPESVHPLQAYWSMPRRIRFDWTGAAPGICAVCGVEAPRLLHRYYTRHGGTNYGGAWMHPLSPYRIDPTRQKSPIARKGQPGGIGYRDWLALTYGMGEDQKPALVIEHAIAAGAVREGLRLWATGGDFDNMKLRGWYDSLMPIYAVRPADRSRFASEVGELIVAVNAAANSLSTRVREVWETEKSEPAVRQSLWEVTEPAFYHAVGGLAGSKAFDPADVLSIRRRWLRTVKNRTLKEFDRWTVRGPLEALELRDVVTARAALVHDLTQKAPLNKLWQSVHELTEKT